MNVVTLAGGVGGARLLVGLQEILGPDELTAVVNTGDDAIVYGLHVSPDVDIVTYWLAGVADRARGWGLRDDTTTVMRSLQGLGVETWFTLGDRDLATCLYRTELLAGGATLSEATESIRTSLGTETRILPMTDDRVATKIATADGRTLDFQEYFVRERHTPEVREVLLEGISEAVPAPGVLESIERADRIILAPSNPYVSIGPILALVGVREALRRHPHVVAISPIVRGAALKGPAAGMLAALGGGAGASGVAGMYADLCDHFVLDALDRDEIPKVESLGIAARPLNTIMSSQAASAALAGAILEL